MLNLFIGLAIPIGVGIVIIVIIFVTSAQKKTSSKKDKTKTGTTKDPVVKSDQKNKFWSRIWTIAGIVVIVVLVVLAASIVVPIGMSIVSVFKSKPAVTYIQPAPVATETYYTATKAGTKVYMETSYWSACPVNKKEKIKAVSPVGENVIIELGVPTNTHFTAGWYTFYAVNKNKIQFWVKQ